MVWNDGGPAFPQIKQWDSERMRMGHSGMTLRDYFAAKAMSGMLDDVGWSVAADTSGKLAECAYRIADAMLAARESVNGE